MSPEDLKTATALIRVALQEDLADQTDITSTLTIPADKHTTAVMRARKPGIVAGSEVAALAFGIVDPALKITDHVKTGETVEAGQDILTIEGLATSIMTAERTALNLMTHLSGIATATRQYVDAVQGTNAVILDTRKTLPGLRALQKHAVKAGGGQNHRFGLYDAILIKDNHIAMAGGVIAALDQVKAQKGQIKIEIEVDTLEQLEEVLTHGTADIVMLDNMDNDSLKRAVDMVDGRIIAEASGGVNLDTVRGIAETGVDYISVGALSHSVIALDIGLDIDLS